MPDESCNDHKREEDVERNRERVAWNTSIGGEGVLYATRSRVLVEEYNAQCCINRISWER